LEESILNVNIDISTRQAIGDNEVDFLEVKTLGRIYYKKDGVYIVYKEVEDEMEVTNTIKILDGSISIKKFGNVESLMTFKEDCQTTTKYKTPQGVILMNIKTNFMSIDFKDDDSVEVNLNYDIEIQDLLSGKNDINIKITKAE